MPTEFSSEQLEGLRALETVDRSDTAGQFASTEDFAHALHAMQATTPGPRSSRPWHGNRELLMSLEAAGLLEVHMNIAKFRAFDAPIPRADEEEDFFLRLTDQGRDVLRQVSAAN
jgi:hypothetical protein